MAITWSAVNNNTAASYSYDSEYEARYDGRISVSRDGQTIALPDSSNARVAATRDGGTTWESIAYPLDFFIYDTACGNNGFIVAVGFEGAWIYDWDTETWTHAYSAEDCETVSCNEDGQYILTVSYTDDMAYYSNDYGETWSVAGAYNGAGGTAINRNGSVMMYTETIHVHPDNFAQIHASYDYGENWAQIWTDPTNTGAARQIAMDDDGTNIVLIYDNPETGMFSTDGGANWIAKDIVPVLSYPCSSYSAAVDLSCDGTAIVLTHWVNGVWTSDDFGDTWTRSYPTLASDSSWWVITTCVSGGMYWKWYGAQFIGTSNTNIFVINETYEILDLAVTGGVTMPICYSSDLGATWTYDAYYAGWTVLASWGVASDSTGSIFLIGSNGNAEYPCKSIDSGNTWTNLTVESGSSGEYHDFEWGVAMSSNGVYMALLTYLYGWLYMSSNTGISWNKIIMPGIDESNQGYGTIIRMSYDGSCILVTRLNRIGVTFTPMRYISTNYGVSFTDITASSYSFNSAAMNENGSFILTGTYNAIYSSTNYGSSFTNITSQIKTDTGVANVNPTKIEIDITGTYLYMPDSISGFLYSANGGTLWQKISGSQLAIIGTGFNDATSSYDGTKVFITDYNSETGQVYVSNDYGVTWASDEGLQSGNFRRIDSNEAGSKLISSTDYYVYLGRTIAGRIKSISGIMIENINKVMTIPIDNLKKISGEEN